MRNVLPIRHMERLDSFTLLRAFCLLAATLSTADVAAETFYVRNGGDDGANGLSHDTAWETLAKVNATKLAPGDRILFLEGNSWSGQLRVSQSGTAGQPIIIGAYHLENGLPVRGVETHRPTLDGMDAVPAQYDGLVRVRGDYVRVENLAVVGSAGRGIQFEDAAHATVIDCTATNSYKSGIKLLRSDHGLAQGNLVTRAGLAWPKDGAVWGGAIQSRHQMTTSCVVTRR